MKLHKDINTVDQVSLSSFFFSSHCYSYEEYAQMSLRTWVNVVYGKMTSIDRSVAVYKEIIVSNFLCCGRNIMADILQTFFKYSLLFANLFIFIQVSLNFVVKGHIDNKSAFVQIMAWHRTGAKLSPKPMMTQFIAAYMRCQAEWVKVWVSWPNLDDLSYNFYDNFFADTRSMW